MHSRLMLSVVGCHAEGEVGDVIVGGFLPPAGATMFERMRAMERDFDHVAGFCYASLAAAFAGTSTC